MKILVDADACPVKEIILQEGKKHQVLVLLIADNTHILESNSPMVQVITVDKGSDSADFAMVNRTCAGDICVTADYGLAAMLLAKEATVIHPNGFFYSPSSIDKMLFERHLAKEMRRQNRHFHGKTPKRSSEKDLAFLQCLQKALST